MDFEIINSLLVIFVFIISQLSVMGVKKTQNNEEDFYKNIVKLSEKIEENERKIKELSERIEK
jgi:peptidoglycan hydrolase CwlO-like protein